MIRRREIRVILILISIDIRQKCKREKLQEYPDYDNFWERIKKLKIYLYVHN